jgi:hypothetical protein
MTVGFQNLPDTWRVGFGPKSRGTDGKPTNYFRRILVRNDHLLLGTDGEALLCNLAGSITQAPHLVSLTRIHAVATILFKWTAVGPKIALAFWPMKQEAYSGTTIRTGGPAAAKSIGFDFRVNRYITDEEFNQLATLLKEKGPVALRTAMDRLDVGRINPTR